MSQPGPGGSVSDRLETAAASALVGRVDERSRLAALLAPLGPAAVFVHGPGGIGKTALVDGTLAGLPMKWVRVDGRHVEGSADDLQGDGSLSFAGSDDP